MTTNTATDSKISTLLATATAKLSGDRDQIVGTCPCCFGVFVVNGTSMVRHGWKEAGGRQQGCYGMTFQSGGCRGEGRAAFNVSRVATIEEASAVAAYIVDMQAKLVDLSSNPPLTGYRAAPTDAKITSDSPAYPRAHARHSRMLTIQIKAGETDLAHLNAMIAGWAPADFATRQGAEDAKKAEVKARNDERLAKKAAKAAAAAARKEKAAAKLAKKLAPVNAALHASAPGQWFSEAELMTLSKQGGEGKLTDAQFWDFNLRLDLDRTEAADGTVTLRWALPARSR